MGLGNALRLSATGKEHSSLWWHEMRSAQTTFDQSFHCTQPLHNLFVVIANSFDFKHGEKNSKGEFTLWQMKDVLHSHAKCALFCFKQFTCMRV